MTNVSISDIKKFLKEKLNIDADKYNEGELHILMQNLIVEFDKIITQEKKHNEELKQKLIDSQLELEELLNE